MSLPGFARPSTGSVIGTLMNDPAALAALGDAVHQPPYKAPPRAPVLYLKPRNTWAAPGAAVVVPADPGRLELGAAVALVIGRTACRVAAADAQDFIAGITLVADLSVPHDSFYRPSVRFKARDGSCLIGTAIATGVDPDAIVLEVFVDGQSVRQTSARGFVRNAAQLLADVSDFMTLRAGDLLLLGVAHGAPLLRAGQSFRIEAAGLAALEGRTVAEAP